MKKLLIASAALAMVAGTAQAQSSVQVYGLMDIGFADSENVTTTDAGVATTVKQKNTGNGHGGLATSRLGFRGTEDLGGGMKANFVLEYALGDAGIGGTGGQTASTTLADAGVDTNSTNGFTARYSWVGLEDAKLGQLRLGRQEASIHSIVTGGSAGGANNVAGAIYSAGINGNPNSSGVRPHTVFVNRAVTYISPRFNGFTAELQMAEQDVQNGTTKTYNKTSGGSLKYSAGKFSAGYGMTTGNIDTTAASTQTLDATTGAASAVAANTASLDKKNQAQAINAVYDFGVVKAFALYTEKKVTVSTSGSLDSDTKATEIGLQMPMGKTVLFASAFDGSRKGNTQTALATANADLSGYQVGAIYNLSKRTAAYAIYGNQEVKAKANQGKVETTNIAAGVRHSF
jgi:predicted porin